MSSKVVILSAKSGISGTIIEEEATQNASLNVWYAIKNKNLPCSSARDMHAYILTIISRSISSSFPKKRTREFPIDVLFDLAIRSNHDPVKSMEIRELIESVRGEACRKIKLRFPMASDSLVSMTVDECLSGRVVSDIDIRKSGIKDPKFFRESSRIYVRMVLHSFREEAMSFNTPVRNFVRESFSRN